MRGRPILLLTGLSFVVASIGSFTVAAQSEVPQAQTAGDDRSGGTRGPADTQQQVNEAVRVVDAMKIDGKLMDLVARASGVFIVPKYGKAAAVVGGQGGEGVLLTHVNGNWQGPAFYDFGRISIGAQAGGEGGAIAMLLMNDKAVNAFRSGRNNFSLDTSAGLTVLEYSTNARGGLDKSDVIVWSDTKGLFAGAAIGVSDIHRDDKDNRAYYLKATTPQEIFSGAVNSAHASKLRDAMPDRVAAN